jgi:hypothetical protein
VDATGAITLAAAWRLTLSATSQIEGHL